MAGSAKWRWSKRCSASQRGKRNVKQISEGGQERWTVTGKRKIHAYIECSAGNTSKVFKFFIPYLMDKRKAYMCAKCCAAAVGRRWFAAHACNTADLINSVRKNGVALDRYGVTMHCYAWLTVIFIVVIVVVVRCNIDKQSFLSYGLYKRHAPHWWAVTGEFMLQAACKYGKYGWLCLVMKIFRLLSRHVYKMLVSAYVVWI